MDDLISRQQAIEAVKKNTFRLAFAEEQNCERRVAWSTKAVYSELMEEALLDIPAQPEQRWIPCGERLPEVGKGVLLTTTFPTVIIGWLKSDGKWLIYEKDGNSFQGYITAWMPLPEPYQEGGAE